MTRRQLEAALDRLYRAHKYNWPAVARALGVSQPSVSRYANGLQFPRPAMVEKIRALDIKMRKERGKS